MDINLVIDDETAKHLLEQLGSKKLSLQRLKLKQLDKLLKGCDDIMILEAYLLWLHQGFLAGNAPPFPPQHRSAHLQSWCQRLQNFGFDRRRVFNALCNWSTAQLSLHDDIIALDHLEIVEEELQRIWLRSDRHRTAKKKRLALDRPPVADKSVEPLLQHAGPPAHNGDDSTDDHRASFDRKSQGTSNAIEERPLQQTESSSRNSHDRTTERNTTLDHMGRDSSSVTKKVEITDNSSDDDKSEVQLVTHFGPNEEHVIKESTEQLQSDEMNTGNSRSTRRDSRGPRAPPAGYTCYRCGVIGTSLDGHFYKDCPTVFDPAYDTRPGVRHKCQLCNKLGDHFATLCPLNTEPDSLIQQRLRKEDADTRHWQDRDGTSSSRVNTGPSDTMHEERRRAIAEHHGSHDIGEDGFEYRYIRAKRNFARQRSPDTDPRHSDKSRRASPPPKRSRIEDRRQGHRQADHNQGRLSYWDTEYLTPEDRQEANPVSYQQSFSSKPRRLGQQPSAEKSHFENNKELKIKRMHPEADFHWVREMASAYEETTYDVDAYLNELMASGGSGPSNAHAAISCIDTIAEQSDEDGYSPQYSPEASSCANRHVDDASLEDDNGHGPPGRPGVSPCASPHDDGVSLEKKDASTSCLDNKSVDMDQADQSRDTVYRFPRHRDGELGVHRRTVSAVSDDAQSVSSTPKSHTSPASVGCRHYEDTRIFSNADPQERLSIVVPSMADSMKIE